MNTEEFVLFEEMEHTLRLVWTNYHQYILPKDTDLSAQQLYFLKYVQHQHSCTPSDLSKAFGITLGALTGFIDRLCKLGLVTRNRTEEDRRLVLIQITEKGLETLKRFEEQKKLKYSEMKKEFKESHVKELNDLLKRLETTLESLIKQTT